MSVGYHRRLERSIGVSNVLREISSCDQEQSSDEGSDSISPCPSDSDVPSSTQAEESSPKE
jgi:hypothetical protein